MENEVKEPAPIYNRMKPDEYLAMERAAETKHEYFDGHITAMSGASVNHLQITTNLIVGIGSFLEDKECTIFAPDMRVGTSG
jgi:Uma2 family endonuclease